MSTPVSRTELPEQLARRVTSWKTLVLAAAGLLAAGGAGVLYSQRYARADDLQRHVEAEAAARGALERKVERHDAVLDYIHTDLEAIRSAVGAGPSGHR